MKKRLIAAALTIVMLFCALPLYAAATPAPTLSDLITASISSGNTTYYISQDLVVSADTVVPAGFTLHLMYGVKLVLNAKLTVKGVFMNFGMVINTANLTKDNGEIYHMTRIIITYTIRPTAIIPATFTANTRLISTTTTPIIFRPTTSTAIITTGTCTCS